ncbi:MAG: class I SAM-dependent methyltransferase [Aestuariivita sp.]|nr:class I SAM-dependent methyltransferase [Aestuariivita sp.]
MNLPIHPFPARMAPELALDALRTISGTVKVLDPMSGSGTTLRHASERGHQSYGRDLDPLAILMAKVWTTPIGSSSVEQAFSEVLVAARMADPSDLTLPWIDDDLETARFVDFWFGGKQRDQLRCLSAVLHDYHEHLSPNVTSNDIDVLRVALSRIIVTKAQRASLARDAAHSRPHKVAEVSDYDVMKGFKVSKDQVLRRLSKSNLVGHVQVRLGDARKLDFENEHFDLIVTSPPYLNAIDYMRGHKLGLVWLGYSISQLRDIRSNSIGAEKARNPRDRTAETVVTAFGDISRLPARDQAMIDRYAIDLSKALSEAARVLKSGAVATYVIGNSCLKGVFINNSSAIIAAARQSGLEVLDEVVRSLPENRRYLPVNTESRLSQRMRTETILTFRKL